MSRHCEVLPKFTNNKSLSCVNKAIKCSDPTVMRVTQSDLFSVAAVVVLIFFKRVPMACSLAFCCDSECEIYFRKNLLQCLDPTSACFCKTSGNY